MKCSFCDSGCGVDQQRDGNGRVFYCCGWCWAHVLGGGFIPQNIQPTIERTRLLRTRRNAAVVMHQESSS